MCGITGFISKEKSYLSELKNATSQMLHRGPDGHDTYTFTGENCNIGLGHTRLSIIDLSSNANQPFHSSDGKYTITFNGEIYNYQELKKELKEMNFRTSSDTEVLINLYIKFGSKMLNKLQGMFAFCIFDHENESLFFARDHLGIKPLYYAMNPTSDLFFASEIKSLFHYDGSLKKVSNTFLSEFLLNGFIYEPNTGYENIYKLPPGHFAEFKLNTGLSITKYWSPFMNNQQQKDSDIEDQIKDSIKLHEVSDVPVGLFFSGGVDSSIILKHSEASNSLVFKPDQDQVKEAGMTSDYDYAKLISKEWNSPLEEVESQNKDFNNNKFFLKTVEELATLTEEPISDFTFVASRNLSQAARDRGYKVMLSGMGADELFGGYDRYRLVKFHSLFKILWYLIPNWFLKRSLSFQKKTERLTNYFGQKDFGEAYTSTIGYFSKEQIERLLISKPHFDRYKEKLERLLEDVPSKTSRLKKAMYLDYFGFLSHNFLVADKSSMLESVELRVPLASKSLAESVMQFDDRSILSFFKAKKILKNFLEKHLNKKIVNRRKAGFNPPLDGYIRSLGKELIVDQFSKNGLYRYLNAQELTSILDEHFDNKSNNTYKIYQLLYLGYWLKNID